MAEGRSNAGIAGALVVSEGAVEKHVSGIFGKLALPSAPTDHRHVLAVLRLRAVSDTGDIQLDLLAAPRSLDARSETGEIDLAVPGDVNYRVDARTRSGEERVLVPVDPASQRIIRAEGSSGDVNLRPSR